MKRFKCPRCDCVEYFKRNNDDNVNVEIVCKYCRNIIEIIEYNPLKKRYRKFKNKINDLVQPYLSQKSIFYIRFSYLIIQLILLILIFIFNSLIYMLIFSILFLNMIFFEEIFKITIDNPL